MEADIALNAFFSLLLRPVYFALLRSRKLAEVLKRRMLARREKEGGGGGCLWVSFDF